MFFPGRNPCDHVREVVAVCRPRRSYLNCELCRERRLTEAPVTARVDLNLSELGVIPVAELVNADRRFQSKAFKESHATNR